MSLQYISDDTGMTTAVIIPIEEWNDIRNRHPEVEGELPQWQKNIIDERLREWKDNPESSIPLDDFIRELEAGMKDEF